MVCDKLKLLKPIAPAPHLRVEGPQIQIQEKYFIEVMNNGRPSGAFTLAQAQKFYHL